MFHFLCPMLMLQLSTQLVINTPPRFTDVISDVELYKVNGSTALVSYPMPSCVDDEEGPLLVECTPAPGQLVAINTNLVNCSCTDSSNETDTTQLRDPEVVEETCHHWAITAVLLVVMFFVLVLQMVVMITRRKPVWLSCRTTAGKTNDQRGGDPSQTLLMNPFISQPSTEVEGVIEEDGDTELQKLPSRHAPPAVGRDEAGTSSSVVSHPSDYVPKNKGIQIQLKDTLIAHPSSEGDGVIEADGDTLEDSKKAVRDSFSKPDRPMSPPRNLIHISAIRRYKAEVERSYLLEFSVATNKEARLQICCNTEGKPSGVVFNIDPSEKKIRLNVDDRTEEAVGFDRCRPSVFQLHGEKDNIKLFLLEEKKDEQILLLSSTDKLREMYRFLAVFGSTVEVEIEKNKGLCRR